MTDISKSLNNNAEIIEFALEAKTALSEGNREFVKECLEVILSLGRENNELLIKSLDEIKQAKESNATLSEKIRHMEKLIDDMQRRMTKLDKSCHESFCKKTFRMIWNALDSKSKDYLITASYITALIRVNNGEYSPAIIEMGRAVENELREKLFDRYIRIAAEQGLFVREEGNDPLYDAVDDLRRRDSYYISMHSMFVVLSSLSRAHNPNSCIYNFLSNLDENEWDSAGLADHDFVSNGFEYTQEYRNRAAHPSRMQEIDRVTCKSRTKELLQHYFCCNQSLRDSMTAE